MTNNNNNNSSNNNNNINNNEYGMTDFDVNNNPHGPKTTSGDIIKTIFKMIGSCILLAIVVGAVLFGDDKPSSSKEIEGEWEFVSSEAGNEDENLIDTEIITTEMTVLKPEVSPFAYDDGDPTLYPIPGAIEWEDGCMYNDPSGVYDFSVTDYRYAAQIIRSPYPSGGCGDQYTMMIIDQDFAEKGALIVEMNMNTIVSESGELSMYGEYYKAIYDPNTYTIYISAFNEAIDPLGLGLNYKVTQISDDINNSYNCMVLIDQYSSPILQNAIKGDLNKMYDWTTLPN